MSAMAPTRDAQSSHGPPSREDVTGGQVPTPTSQSFNELNASAREAAVLPEVGGNLKERTGAEHFIISEHPLHFDIPDAHGEDRVPPPGSVDRMFRPGPHIEAWEGIVARG